MCLNVHALARGVHFISTYVDAMRLKQRHYLYPHCKVGMIVILCKPIVTIICHTGSYISIRFLILYI